MSDDVLDEQVEEVPGLDLTLENKRSNEFEAACKALDGRAQAVVGELLAGPEVTGATDIGATAPSAEIVKTLTKTHQMVGSETTGGVMRAALEMAGITPTHLANVLGEGLKARKSVLSKGKARKVPDYAVRIRYLELAHRLRGDLSKAEQGSGAEMTYEERLRVVMRKDS